MEKKVKWALEYVGLEFDELPQKILIYSLEDGEEIAWEFNLNYKGSFPYNFKRRRVNESDVLTRAYLSSKIGFSGLRGKDWVGAVDLHILERDAYPGSSDLIKFLLKLKKEAKEYGVEKEFVEYFLESLLIHEFVERKENHLRALEEELIFASSLLRSMRKKRLKELVGKYREFLKEEINL